MRFLIDTHVLIWHLEDDKRLPTLSSKLIDDPENSVLISVASLWELSIKISRKRLELSRSIDEIVSEIEQSTFTFLDIKPPHLIRVSGLPFHHSDPFDRLIISQSLVEEIPVMTVDQEFSDYGVVLL